MPSAAHEVDREIVERALREVLESQFFRGTAQCSALLRYIVSNTLTEQDENLRERVIGCEVFRRRHDYDTGNDHVVRSRAAEVRKRLALYYQDGGRDAPIRISVPSGSYRAVFDSETPPAAEKPTIAEPLPPEPIEMPAIEPQLYIAASPEDVAETTTAAHQKNAWRGAALFALLLCAALAFWPHRHVLERSTEYTKFWSPLLKSPKPVLIYCGGGFVYKLSDAYLDHYKVQHGINDQRNEFFIDPKRGDPVQAADLIPDRHFVPFGDLAATSRVVSLLTQSEKPYDLRYGEDVAFTELHSSPVILVGGLNNTWALRVTHDLRYVLQGEDQIVDRTDSRRVWQERVDPEKQARDDYAVISWLNQSETGGFVLSIAGIRTYSTWAASDLLTDPVQMNRVLANAPAGWEKRNLQMVIHTRTLNDIPVSSNIEAMHFW